MKKLNKKGMTVWIIGAIIVLGIIAVIFISKGALASSMTSVTPKKAGCDSPKIPVTIKGSGSSRDSASIGVVTEPEKVSIKDVTSGGSSLCVFCFSQDYTWNVKLVDDFTGNEVASDRGSNNHPGGSVLTEDPFSLSFFIDDNDCNGAIDDFDGKIVYEVRTDDGTTPNPAVKSVSFRNGRLVR